MGIYVCGEQPKAVNFQHEAMFREDEEWANKAIAPIEVQIEMAKGMGNPKGYHSDIFADLPEVGSERRKEKKPEIKFNENQEDLPIIYH